jgi:3-hydroxyacyl-CoA dehydrogenase
MSGVSRPSGFGKFRPRRIGVIGAGVMGSGIAFTAAKEGLEVVVKDISELVAKRSKDYASEILSNFVEREILTEDECSNVLNLIKPSGKNEDFDGCDLVIEAVYENKILKQR